jgi:transposase
LRGLLLLPPDTRGKPRLDDRRVISIVHVRKSVGRWIDAPYVYGPHKTLYYRFVQWAAKGVRIDIFDILALAGGPPAQVLIDSSAVKAHRCASGGKGGSKMRRWPIARWTQQNPRSDRYSACRPIAFLLTGCQVADCLVLLFDRGCGLSSGPASSLCASHQRNFCTLSTL